MTNESYFAALRNLLEQMENFAAKNPTVLINPPTNITLKVINDKKEGGSQVLALGSVNVRFDALSGK